ncbi:DSS1/SEM1 family-domain-containing protein [Ilyonectria robusta]|uniref:DSS1/SEM1 family-domain-containing protein n=1 Tax=Ilyonectria robusta TaxID=1079257 RepID=UPI001E8EEABF|nr:DSS1/SEM1 family-domain-containing protein [Ilyonectria robusta]KAH8675107.1 DSS1/SEM1 family-domain-containing protein [Ilyonectria robusta]
MASDTKPAEEKPAEQKPEQKPTALGEDDEFEDFPVDDWPEDQTEAAQGSGETKHLWEESWDDDDTTDDFSAQLKWVALDPPSSPRFDWTDSIRQIQSRNVLWQYFDDTG